MHYELCITNYELFDFFKIVHIYILFSEKKVVKIATPFTKYKLFIVNHCILDSFD